MMAVRGSDVGSPSKQAVVALGPRFDASKLVLRTDRATKTIYVAYVPKDLRGLRRRDSILAVNGVSTVSTSIESVMDMLQQESTDSGTTVLVGGDPNLHQLEMRRLAKSSPFGIKPVDRPPHGVVVHAVVPDSPAEKSGLMEGDILCLANNRTIKTSAMLRGIMLQSALQVKFVVSRGCDQSRCLIQQKTLRAGELFCNSCNIPVPIGAMAMCCRKCDWDLCLTCFANMGESNRDRQRTTTTASATATTANKVGNSSGVPQSVVQGKSNQALEALAMVEKRRLIRAEEIKKVKEVARQRAADEAKQERQCRELARSKANEHCRVTDSEVSCAWFDIKTIPNEVAVVYAKTAKRLELSFNQIQVLTSTHAFTELEELVVDNNKLEVPLDLPELPRLRLLSINNNNLRDLHELMVEIKEQCPKLEYLSMLNNKCCPTSLLGETNVEYELYRQYIIRLMPNLKFLDCYKITDQDRMDAEERFRYAAAPTVRPIKEIILPIQQTISGLFAK